MAGPVERNHMATPREPLEEPDWTEEDEAQSDAVLDALGEKWRKQEAARQYRRERLRTARQEQQHPANGDTPSSATQHETQQKKG